jgi:hypothetical protein
MKIQAIPVLVLATTTWIGAKAEGIAAADDLADAKMQMHAMTKAKLTLSAATD